MDEAPATKKHSNKAMHCCMFKPGCHLVITLPLATDTQLPATSAFEMLLPSGFCIKSQIVVRVTWDSGDVDHFVREALQLQDGQG
jgi:hypothetical protein